MRQLNSQEVLAVSGGGRTCGGNTTSDPSTIAAITSALQSVFNSDVSAQLSEFTRQDWADLAPEDLSNWTALAELYERVIAELNS